MAGWIRLTICLVLAAGCTPERSIGIRFDSRPLRDAVTEIRVFAYDLGAEPSARCSRFEPRGALPGDAPTRTGIEATKKITGPLEETVGQLRDLPRGRFTLVLEAWQTRTAEETPPEILRAYACVDLDLDDPDSSEGTVSLDAVAPLDAQMRVPEMLEGDSVTHYDASNPLPVTDGVTADEALIVQLLDANTQNIADTPVRFRVLEGDASLLATDAAATATTTVRTDERGVAAVRVHPGAAASASPGGRIVIEAYAPGFDGAPLQFEARALRSFAVSFESMDLDRNEIDLSDTHYAFRPIVAGDLDGDRRMDLVTVAGSNSHRMLILYGQEGGGFEPVVQPARQRRVLAVALARLRPGATRPTIVSLASDPTDNLPPATEFWDAPANTARPAPGGWSISSSVAPGLLGISVTASDLDGDGTDELGIVRCQHVNSDCWGVWLTNPTNEAVVFDHDPPNRLSEIVKVPGPVNGGGFRRLHFADLDHDGTRDLIATSQQRVWGYCGTFGPRGLTFGGEFFQNITLGQGWALSAGDFDGDDFADIVTVGGFRLSGPRAGLRMFPGCAGCVPRAEGVCGMDVGKAPWLLGPKGPGYQFPLAVHDLNGDGQDDVLNLHRTKHTLYSYLGTGDGGFALGPMIRLPMAVAGELATVATMDGGAQSILAATVAPDENRIVVVRIRPR